MFVGFVVGQYLWCDMFEFLQFEIIWYKIEFGEIGFVDDFLYWLLFGVIVDGVVECVVVCEVQFWLVVEECGE